MKKILSITLVFFAAVLCVNAQDIPSKQDSVLGTWVWKKRECCNMGGGSLRKADPNKREKVIIMEKDSVFKQYENNELVHEGKYKVVGLKFMKDPISYSFYSKSMYGMMRYKKDTLIIGNCAGDGCDDYFVKDQPVKKKAVKKKRKVKRVHTK